MSRKIVITRHETLVNALRAISPDIIHVQQIPQDLDKSDIVLGVLPIDLIKRVTDVTGRFIYVAVDPARFTRRFGVEYNPKTADQYINQISALEFIELLRFLEYMKVSIEETGFPDVSGKKVFYRGSSIIAKAIESRGGKVVSNKEEAEIYFSPVESRPFYSIRFLDRDLIIKTPEEFFNAIDDGKVAILKVDADVREVDLEHIKSLLQK